MKSETRLGLSLDAFVLFSLVLQLILVTVAPWRKHGILMFPVVALWYLLESRVAYYAVGLIPNNTVQGGRSGELRVFWAPYLILHLGGPSTITSLSLADNELWLRYAAGLVSLSYTFGRVFLHSFLKSDLWVPTALVFFAGSLRYIEKVICRFLARLTKFRASILPKPDPGVSYAKLINLHSSFSEAGVPVRFDCWSSSSSAPMTHPPAASSNNNNAVVKLSQVMVVKEAYKLFHDFRGLFVNAVCSSDLRDETRRHFLSRDAEDAFDIAEVELNFAYDVFYTKSILIHKPLLQWIGVVSFFLQVLSTVLWIRIDKTSFHKSSVRVTHALVFGSISLDLFSFFMLAASDWNIAWVKHSKAQCFFEVLLSFKKQARAIQRRLWNLRWLPFCTPSVGCHIFRNFRLFFRWSECIPKLNLIDVCSREIPMSRIVTQSRYYGVIQRYHYMHFTHELKNFIFEEMVIRSVHAKQPKDAEELCSARGMWVLTLLSHNRPGLSDLAKTLKPWLDDVDYEESLILWHIATTLCYFTVPAEDDLSRCSIILADYMLHLLIRPYTSAMLPSVQILGCKIYLDTCADAKRFFDRKLPQQRSKLTKEERLRQACEKIMQVNTTAIHPSKIRGDESKSVLFDGCLLAQELRRLNSRINIWEIISKVWAEMLFHCVPHSRASVHLEKLGKGGELLTLIWLLMTHLGLGNKHFRYKKDRAAELVIGENMS